MTEHFSQEEAEFSDTAVRLGIENRVPEGLLLNVQGCAEGLEQTRAVLGGHPLHINSWYRCAALNARIGGSSKSAHMQGWAADFTCPGFGIPLAVARVLRDSGLAFDQLIMEGTWVHISFAPTRRRQVLTATFTAGVAHYKEGLA